jgi:hypothetical protein
MRIQLFAMTILMSAAGERKHTRPPVPHCRNWQQFFLEGAGAPAFKRGKECLSTPGKSL